MMRQSLAILFFILLILPVNGRAATNHCEYPNVMVVLDRSTSMATDNKWTIAREATGNLVNFFDDSINFGLIIMPGEAPTIENGSRCHTGEVKVPIGRGTASEIEQNIPSQMPGTNAFTPTNQTLIFASEQATLLEENKKNYVIIITDGEQDCKCELYGTISNPYYHWSDWCDESNYTQERDPVDGVKALTEKNIITYVIGFGLDIYEGDLTEEEKTFVQNLNWMAYFGGTAKEGCYTMLNGLPDIDENNRCFYEATDDTDLNAALNQIARQITEETCDGLDNNCDGTIDEGLSEPCETECGTGFKYCIENGTGSWGDCDAPQPIEFDCGNKFVTICPGDTPPCDCTPGDTKPCGTDVGECQAGTIRCQNDYTWGQCEGAIEPAPEICDGKDNNCNGQVDEGDLCEDGMACYCGGCQEPCIFGECFNGAVCFNGYCLVDMCPEGMHCENGACVSGEENNNNNNNNEQPEEYPDTGNNPNNQDNNSGLSGSSSSVADCNCRFSQTSENGLFMLFLLLAAFMLTLRKAYAKTEK